LEWRDSLSGGSALELPSERLMKEPTIVGQMADGFLRTMSAERNPDAVSPLDFAVLEVALLVAGLDGRIQSSETRAFWQLAQRCPAYTPESAQDSFERAMRGAGYLVAIGQPGVFTRAQRVEAFVSESLKILRESGFSEALKDPVKAFAIWTAMACADKDFSDIEQMGLRTLCERFSTLYVKREK